MPTNLERFRVAILTSINRIVDTCYDPIFIRHVPCANSQISGRLPAQSCADPVSRRTACRIVIEDCAKRDLVSRPRSLATARLGGLGGGDYNGESLSRRVPSSFGHEDARPIGIA